MPFMDGRIRIRVFTSAEGFELVIVGAQRKGRETRIKLTYAEADELAEALTQRLVSRVPNE